MKCNICNGKGFRPKHLNCNHNAHDSYVRGCGELIRCSRCHGSGTTGAELVKDILLEIKLQSNDEKSRLAAERALKEWSDF